VQAEHAARLVVRLKVADDEAAAVQVDEEVFAPRRRRVVARAQAAGRAVDFEVAHVAHPRLRAAEDENFSSEAFARGRGVGLAESVAHALAVEREDELQTRVEALPVNFDLRAAGELELHARGQAAEGARGRALHALGACDVCV
jgi:hypothetical protein